MTIDAKHTVNACTAKCMPVRSASMTIEYAFCAEVSDTGKASQDQQEGDFDLYDIPGVDTRLQLPTVLLLKLCACGFGKRLCRLPQNVLS